VFVVSTQPLRPAPRRAPARSSAAGGAAPHSARRAPRHAPACAALVGFASVGHCIAAARKRPPAALSARARTRTNAAELRNRQDTRERWKGARKVAFSFIWLNC
jgi:hypothetical protein